MAILNTQTNTKEQDVFVIENSTNLNAAAPSAANAIACAQSQINPNLNSIISISTQLSYSGNVYGTFGTIDSSGTRVGYKPAVGKRFVCLGAEWYIRPGASSQIYIGLSTNDVTGPTNEASSTAPTVPGGGFYLAARLGTTGSGVIYRQALFFTVSGSQNMYISANWTPSGSGVASLTLFGIEVDDVY